jgi:drug/metabolite transporter (DMT)-like permease
MTKGYRTSEFWISLLAVIVGAVLSSGAIPSEGPWAQIAGLVATILGALGYSVPRAFVKSTELKAQALTAANPTQPKP